MIKTILVGLDGSEHSRTATRYALWLGRRFEARVVGLHVVDIVSIEGSFFHDISGSLGFEPYLDFSTKMREVLQERGEALLEEFRNEAGAADVPYETVLGIGIVPNEICERARTADLVVIGHRGINEKFSTGLLGGSAESVTRKSPKPVWVCSTEFREVSRPLLAYDGSQRASAALAAAADFCSQLRLPLTVLHVNKDAVQGRKTLDEARRYLDSYSLEVTDELEEAGHAPEHIAEFIGDRQHDLLFIGAYGHSRIVEMVLGSTTEYVLRNSHCPVFLSR